MSADLEGRCFVRRGATLVPADEYAGEFLSGIPEGREVIVSIRRPRSPAHHRFFFAMLRAVCDNSERWQTEDELLDAVKIAAGHVERRSTLDGGMYQAPKSINFASMDQDTFKRFYERARYLLATKVLGCDPGELMREVETTQQRKRAA